MPSSRVGRHDPARVLELSNSTTAKFLGGTQKAWMTGQAPSRDKTAQIAARDIEHQKARSSIPNQSAQSPSTAQPAAGQARQDIPFNPSAWTLKSKFTKSGQQASTSHSRSPEIENVLPSPAPSDEHHQGSTCVIDLDSEPPLQNGPANEPDADMLRELTKRYGGIEEIEKRLRAFEAPSGIPLKHPTAQPSTLVQAAGSARPEKRTLDQQSDRPRKMSSTQAGNSPNAGVGCATEPAIFAMPDATLKHFLHILQNTRLGRNPQSRGGKIANSRLGLLQDAVERSDFFYLVLHQIYCMYSQSQRAVWAACIGFQAMHLQGLTLLNHLLIDNSVLEPEAVNWFSTFPLPLQLLLRNHPGFNVAYTKVLDFLKRFHQHWARMKEESRIRHCPPSANEMLIMLGLDSIVLQGVLYRAMHRDTWTGEYDKCYQRCEEAFLRTQQETYNNQVAAKQGLLISQNQAFILRSQELWFSHATYCLASRPHDANQGIAAVGNMAPPQPRQNAIAPARTSSTPGGGPSTSTDRPPLTASVSAAQHFSRWRVSTPTVPSSPAQVSPFSQAGSPMALLGAVSLGSPAQNLGTLTLSPQAGANFQPPSIGRHTHSPAVPMMTQQTPQIPYFNPPSSIASTAQQNGSTPVQSFGGPQSTFASPLSQQQADILLLSYQTTAAASIDSTSPASSAAASTATPGQSPLPRPPRDGFNLATMHNRYVSPHTPQSPTLAGLPQGAGIFLRPLDQLPQVVTASSAVHQAHLRSPLLEAVTSENDASVRWFSYIVDVVMVPDNLHLHQRHLTWHWNESKEDIESLAASNDAHDGRPGRMLVQIGTRICRLRSVKLKSINDVPTESDWVAAENTWPFGIAILINGTAVDVRKKKHHGKDMPINITSSITEGKNSISIAISQIPLDDESMYAFGLENIHITNSSIIKSAIETVSWLEARDRILRRSGLVDPDVQILDPTITLDITDPYSSSLCQTPARGTACRHNQCFDLEIFLSTRGSKAPTEPCGPDQLRCPICGADARPKNLFIDGFLVKVREELEQRKRLDVKAIVLDETGKWDIKEAEETGESGDGTGKRRSMSGGPRTGLNPNNNEVIELNDSD